MGMSSLSLLVSGISGGAKNLLSISGKISYFPFKKCCLKEHLDVIMSSGDAGNLHNVQKFESIFMF